MKKIYLRLVISFIVLFYSFYIFASENNSESRVTAYYFHGRARCFSCRSIEQNTEAALKENFDKELRSGRLVFKHINIEEKENLHFIDEYKLFTRSVVLSLVKDGKEVKWKNLDKVWHLLGSKHRFSTYIKQETQSFLDEVKAKD